MIAPFELDWLGGPAAAHARRRRGDLDDLPWGTLDPAAYPADLVDHARASWTDGAFSEYVSAAAFTELVGALLAAGAPLDLVAMAADFIGDELIHVELNARMAMELGGAVPYLVDLARAAPITAPGCSPLARASELVVRLACVGEAFSVPLLVGTARTASHPLTRAVLTRIVRDEPAHARIGWLYLDWVADRLDDAERARLAAVALTTLTAYRDYWQQPATDVDVRISDVTDLGWMEAGRYAAAARHAVRAEVVAPFAARGIIVDPAAVAALLDEPA